MTHKGGKRAKKDFRRLKGVSKRQKEMIEDLPRSQLMVLLAFIRALLATSKGAGAGRRARRHGAKHHKRTRKLSAGIHRVSIRGKMRKVHVLANGRWRFMKG